jgi:uncharacterized membrane protein YdjX (TVP38/TMEM64 family)
MNTLAYADVGDHDASSASTIASTGQQMAISFGVAAASLVTAVFIPVTARTNPAAMVHGVHLGLLVLGGWTILSSITFRGLRPSDGAIVSRQAAALPA